MSKIKNNTGKVKKKGKRVLKTPIALHFYLAFTVIIMFFFFSFVFGFNQNYESHIKRECSTRIEKAIKSFNKFYEVIQIDPEIGEDPTALRNTLFNDISSATDISNEASLSVFYKNEEESTDDKIKFNVIFPSEDYTSSFETARQLIKLTIEKNGKFDSKELQNEESDFFNTVKSVDVNTGSDSIKYFYMIKPIDYTHLEEKGPDDPEVPENTEHFTGIQLVKDKEYYVYKENFFVIFFVDSSRYYSFATNLNNAMFNTMLISIIIAGLLSIIISFPIIMSTRRLSKFAARISKGDFTTYNGLIASRELNDLSDMMNNMAIRLDEHDKEQKTFFQNASHELRTPLMSIQGYAEGMKYGVFDKDNEQEAIDIIISETTRLSNMVENLLSISKMDLSSANGYVVKKTPVNVYELVGITIEKIRGGFLHSGKELRNTINIKSNVHIFANENDIFRMLENVFSNCLRYASSTVFFKCYTEDKNVVFEISDDGPGISEEVQKHLFDRFAKGSDGKHGIGLALVKAIAKEHNGTVTGGNRDEGGAVFKITIPILPANEQLSLMNKEK